MSDEQNSTSIDTLIDQLKNVPRAVRIVESEEDEVTRENLEQFILKHSTRLVRQASDAITTVKDYVEVAPNAEDVAALSELIRAQGSALAELNKMFISDQRNQTAIKLRKMDNENRSEQTDKQIGAVVMLTREEAFRQMLEMKKEQLAIQDKDTIEVTIENVVDSTPEGVLDSSSSR